MAVAETTVTASKPKPKPRIDIRALLPFAVFLVAYIFIPRFAQDKALTSLIYIGIYVLLALGLNLLMGYAGQISLGHAAFFGIGAYVSAILTLQPIQQPIIPGMSAGIGVMAATAALMSLTRVSGWKLVASVAGLVVLSSICRAGSLGLGLTVAITAVGMAVLGPLLRIGWWKPAVSGLVGVVTTLVCSRFLGGVLAHGGTSPWIGIMVGILVTGLIAYLIGALVLRLKGHYLAMATLGFGVIVKIVFEKWVAVTGGSSDGIYGIPSITIPGAMQHVFSFFRGRAVSPKEAYYYLVWLFVFAALILAVNTVRSRVGRAFRAVHGSEQAAESLGVDTERYKIQVFVLSAALASIAGSLYAHNVGVGYISPSEFSFDMSVMLVVVVVIGGLASVWGALFGATAIQLLKDWILTLGKRDITFFGLAIKGLDPIVFGTILIVVMMMLPQGLVRGLTDAVGSALRGARGAAGRKAGQEP